MRGDMCSKLAVAVWSGIFSSVAELEQYVSDYAGGDDITEGRYDGEGEEIGRSSFAEQFDLPYIDSDFMEIHFIESNEAIDDFRAYFCEEYMADKEAAAKLWESLKESIVINAGIILIQGHTSDYGEANTFLWKFSKESCASMTAGVKLCDLLYRCN